MFKEVPPGESIASLLSIMDVMTVRSLVLSQNFLLHKEKTY